MDKNDIIDLIEKDSWMMDVLQTVDKLHLPDWWIGAGFVRSKVWDALHGYDKRTPLPDVDVIYFDPEDFSIEEAEQYTTAAETRYESLLQKQMPDIHWSVTNQARMHIFHDHKPYRSAEEGLAHWVETATCIGVKLDKSKIVVTAPHGIHDLVHLLLRPTPGAYKEPQIFYERIRQKKWLEKWPKLRVTS